MFADRLASSETAPPSQALLPDHPISNPLTQSLSSLSPQLLSLYNNLPDYAELSSAGPQDALRLHALLSVLDPTVASRWHWKDMRKVLRSIRYIRDTGRRLSETLSQQSQIDVTPRWVI
jgi:tRNA dimethylallyltransferase